MTQTLLDAVRRHSDAHADALGIAQTPVAGLSTVRATRPSELQYAVNRPLVALVLQGRKRVTMGRESFDFGAGDSLLIAADVPTVSQITRADLAIPYYSFVLELDPAVIEPLAREMRMVQQGPGARISVDPTDAEVADAALRLLRVLDRPAALAVLKDQLVRELHFWLLAGRHGASIRALGVAGSHAQRIGRAVAMIREGYAQPLRVERLAEAAGMSPSSFHHHFRAVTSLSPLQFQKQLRLIEARRMMLSEGIASSHAAYAVGYESIPQFTREYGRVFGVTPARDMKQARSGTNLAA
ncbi:AraC family transcriptional regulator [Roseococcus suduntuyensis]|uniref:AraC-like DNA-binding protein n=1 Tax=Roseococcus suduntuyensis TaxID=455361 RepID=A0A840AE82_9PROT|nr:AraC family transcriptional regulator [Roseococcus suduntuyensis]MBB3898740.1 AraC-like DNA-binding protein [Roseococcus suduntuyensis]